MQLASQAGVCRANNTPTDWITSNNIVLPLPNICTSEIFIHAISGVQLEIVRVSSCNKARVPALDSQKYRILSLQPSHS